MKINTCKVLKQKCMLLWIQNSVCDHNFILSSSRAKKPIRRQKLRTENVIKEIRKYILLLLAENYIKGYFYCKRHLECGYVPYINFIRHKEFFPVL